MAEAERRLGGPLYLRRLLTVESNLGSGRRAEVARDTHFPSPLTPKCRAGVLSHCFPREGHGGPALGCASPDSRASGGRRAAHRRPAASRGSPGARRTRGARGARGGTAPPLPARAPRRRRPPPGRREGRLDSGPRRVPHAPAAPQPRRGPQSALFASRCSVLLFSRVFCRFVLSLERKVKT